MGEMSELLKSNVETLAKQMVDKPEDVNVTSSISTKAVIIQIKVAQSDCGKIIGKHGKTIDALKVICLNVKNTKFPEDSRRVILEVLEDEDADYCYK
jgi:predicted RNA-binding protein YlqC (UPF0109 family)